MQKGQTLIHLLIGILVLAGVAGGAYYLGRSVIPKPSPSPVIVHQTPQPAKFVGDKSEACIKEEQVKNYVKGSIIVDLQEEISLSEAEKIMSSYGLVVGNSLDPIKTLFVKVPVGSEVEWVCKFRKDNRFKSAGVDHIISVPDCKQGPC